MSKIEKLKAKLFRKPVPNDITFNEVKTLAEHYGCIIEGGGNHTKIVHVKTGNIIPIPRHDKTVKEAYIKDLKELFEQIEVEKDEI